MKYDSVVNSLTEYIAAHPEVKVKRGYEIYNEWAMTTNTIIKDVSFVQWMMNYIDDLNRLSQPLINDAVP